MLSKENVPIFLLVGGCTSSAITYIYSPIESLLQLVCIHNSPYLVFLTYLTLSYSYISDHPNQDMFASLVFLFPLVSPCIWDSFSHACYSRFLQRHRHISANRPAAWCIRESAYPPAAAIPRILQPRREFSSRAAANPPAAPRIQIATYPIANFAEFYQLGSGTD